MQKSEIWRCKKSAFKRQVTSKATRQSKINKVSSSRIEDKKLYEFFESIRHHFRGNQRNLKETLVILTVTMRMRMTIVTLQWMNKGFIQYSTLDDCNDQWSLLFILLNNKKTLFTIWSVSLPSGEDTGLFKEFATL